MNLSEFIKVLQELEAEGHGDLPVCLADWWENYSRPSQHAVCAFKTNGTYKSKEDDQEGDFIQIGTD